jgi:RTA1 like protein
MQPTTEHDSILLSSSAGFGRHLVTLSEQLVPGMKSQLHYMLFSLLWSFLRLHVSTLPSQHSVLTPAKCVSEVVAAFNYMLFGRILRTYSSDAGPKALGVSDRWVIRIFVGFDMVSFPTQSVGAAMLAGANGDVRKSNTGQHIVIGGLILQLVAFGFFTAIAVRFHLKMKRSQRVREWQPLLFCLYASCILIMLCMYPLMIKQLHFILLICDTAGSVYRVVEFSQGFDSYLASHEVYFYVLEVVPMMLPFILFNIFHPGRIIKGGFIKRNIDARQPMVLEEEIKSGGDGTDFSNEKL